MNGYFYEQFLAPKTIEEALLAIAIKQSPPEHTDRVHITLTSELVMDICVRVKQLEDPNFLAGGTAPENGANLIED